MMSKQVIGTTTLMQPIAHFSHAARVGDLVYIGATAGTDRTRRLAGHTLGLADAEAQARQMLCNLDTVLELLGAKREHLVHVKSYFNDMRDLALHQTLYREWFQPNPPAHAIVGSAGFPLPQATVELDAVACVDNAIRRLPGGGVRAGARHFCTASPLGVDGCLVEGDIATQSQSTLAQLLKMLVQAGLTQIDVVNLHVTLGDVTDFQKFEVEFQRAFRPPYPARTVVVAPLSQPRMRIQIESVALEGGGRAIGAADPRLGCASPAILAGEALYISGQLGKNTGGQSMDDPELQARAAWLRIGNLLDQAGMGREHVVRTNNILTDWRDYHEFNKGYGTQVNAPYPPRTTVIGRLLDASALVQIEAVAHTHAAEACVLTTPVDTVPNETGRKSAS